MVEELTPAEFAAMRDAGENWQLVDVREAWELAIASLPECIHIPMSEIPARRGEIDPAVPLAVLCHGGVRSARVADFLAGQGYERVANITGGIDAWAEQVDTGLARY